MWYRRRATQLSLGEDFDILDMARQTGNLAQGGILDVDFSNLHVGALHTLLEDVHDLWRDFADLGIL